MAPKRLRLAAIRHDGRKRRQPPRWVDFDGAAQDRGAFVVPVMEGDQPLWIVREEGRRGLQHRRGRRRGRDCRGEEEPNLGFWLA